MEKEENIMRMVCEYLDGEKNGKGREYHKNSKLRFEGEYLNDKKWNGKGRELIIRVN